MNHSSEVAAEVSALVSEWRAKAMSIVLSLLALITLPALLLIVFSQALVGGPGSCVERVWPCSWCCCWLFGVGTGACIGVLWYSSSLLMASPRFSGPRAAWSAAGGYGLTPAEIDLMWKTALPRMPISLRANGLSQRD
jgi:hypothetical protein